MQNAYLTSADAECRTYVSVQIIHQNHHAYQLQHVCQKCEFVHAL